MSMNTGDLAVYHLGVEVGVVGVVGWTFHWGAVVVSVVVVWWWPLVNGGCCTRTNHDVPCSPDDD